MLFQQLNKVDAEKVFVSVKFEDATSTGEVCQWSDTASTSLPLGVAVEDNVTADLRPAGIVEGKLGNAATTAVAASSFGLVQVYGLNEKVLTDGAVAVGDKVVINAALTVVGQSLAEIDSAGNSTILKVIGANLAADTGTVGKIFIKCL